MMIVAFRNGKEIDFYEKIMESTAALYFRSDGV